MRAAVTGATDTCYSFPWKGPMDEERYSFSFPCQVKHKLWLSSMSWSCSPVAQGSLQQDPRPRFCSTQVSALDNVCPKVAHSGGQLHPQCPPTPREPFQAALLPHCPTIATLQPQLGKTVLGC